MLELFRFGLGDEISLYDHVSWRNGAEEMDVMRKGFELVRMLLK